MNQQKLICHNGTFIPHEQATVAINDGAALFGDTLFETLKARKQRILLQWQHLDRMEHSARLIDFPFDRSRIERALQQLSESLSAPTSRIRLSLSRGCFNGLGWPDMAEGQFLISAEPYEEPSSQDRESGVSCISAPNQRVNPLNHLPQLKRGNYADCLYAVNHARQQGAREALFFDADDTCLEGATSNIFALIDDRLITPQPGTLVLDGIMRRQLIDCAAELGILVVERALPRSELLAAAEVFLSNSLIDILPVHSIDGQPIRRGRCYQQLLETLNLRINT